MKIDVKMAAAPGGAAPGVGEGSMAEAAQVAQGLSDDEVHMFAKALASNKKEERDATMRGLRRWIKLREKRAGNLSELELLKLWRGLFFCFWMSDKVPIQQELANALAELTGLFRVPENSVRFQSAFFRTMQREWGGLDKHRVDKFYSLYRYMVREGLRVAASASLLEDYCTVLVEEVVKRKPDGLRFHLCDVYLNELEQSGCTASLSGEDLHETLSPFYIALGESDSKYYFDHVVKTVFRPLLREPLERLRLKDVAASLFSIGADVVEVDRSRKILYELSAEFRKVAASNGEKGQGSASRAASPAARDATPRSDQLVGLGDVSPAKAAADDVDMDDAPRNLKRDFDRMTDDGKDSDEGASSPDAAAQRKAAEKAAKKAAKKAKKDKKDKKQKPEKEVVDQVQGQDTVETPSPAAKSSSKSSKQKSPKVAAQDQEKSPVAESASKSGKKKRRTSLEGAGEATPVESAVVSSTKKKLRFALKHSQELDHNVSMKRLRTTPVKPAAKTSSPGQSALKRSSVKAQTPVSSAEKTSASKKGSEEATLNKRIQIAKRRALENERLSSEARRSKFKGRS